MVRYAASSTDSFCPSRTLREWREPRRRVIGCAAARLAACCSRRSMLNSSARRISSLSQIEGRALRPRARRMSDLNRVARSRARRAAIRIAGYSPTSGHLLYSGHRAPPRLVRLHYHKPSAPVGPYAGVHSYARVMSSLLPMDTRRRASQAHCGSKEARVMQDNTPDAELLRKMDAYWRAANYLSVGQIYLYDNPLLKEPLQLAHVKRMLLGHWGTTPGQNFIYVHLNRVIKKYDLDMIYVSGPGHGGPAVVGNTYLEGTYSEIYPNISQDEAGLRKLFIQFSFPGGIPRHASPECPGSIHEGDELGYSLSHSFGAVFDNPDLIVACVVGDGEAETGPLATAWHSNKFLNPVTDGAVLPILHLNGYKISNPTILARISREELDQLLRGYGWTPYYVEGHEPGLMHEAMATRLDTAGGKIKQIQKDARVNGKLERPRWPMIVLNSPKGWTGPKTVDGLQVEGTFRSHQVPLIVDSDHPEHLLELERWMRSYKPQELFDEDGRLVPELAALAPRGNRRMGANPHANGGMLLHDLRMPDFRIHAVDVPAPGAVDAQD